MMPTVSAAHGRLREALEALRPRIAEAAQEVLDGWEQDEDGYDESFGWGGACDDINRAIQEIIVGTIDGVEVVDGGHDGDDHAWTIVYDDVEAFAVDIPPSVYETGGGYSWKKIDGVRVSPDDIVIEPVRRKDVVVGSFVACGGVDASRIAARVASVNVEAARRKTRSKKKRGKSVVHAPTEWACRAELAIEVSFEGDTAKAALVKKLKTEIAAMVESAVKITARDLKLDPSNVSIRVGSLECVVTSGDYGDYDFDD